MQSALIISYFVKSTALNESTCQRSFLSNNKNDESNVAPANPAITCLCKLHPFAQACLGAIYASGERSRMISVDFKNEDNCEGGDTGLSDVDIWLLNRFVQIAIHVQPPSARD
jgi:hypothetical protein